MYSCGPIFMSGNFNGTVKQCKGKEQSIHHPTNAICDKPFVTYLYCYMFRQSCHYLGLIIAKVYNQHINICSTPPYKVLLYVTNGVSHSAWVVWYIDCKNMHSVNNRKLQNGWINMWTVGTVDVSQKAYTRTNGDLAQTPNLETQVPKLCWWKWLAQNSSVDSRATEIQNPTSRFTRRAVAMCVEGSWKISSDAILFEFSILVEHPPSNGRFLRNLHAVRGNRGEKTDNPTVTILPNVKVKVNARHSISYLSTRLVRETFTFIKNQAVTLKLQTQVGARYNHSSHKTTGEYLATE